MFEFLKIMLIIFMKQILFIISFCFAVHINSNVAYFIPVILLILYLILYFKYSNTICEKLKLDKWLYDIYSLISWVLVGIILLNVLFTPKIFDIIPKGGGMFSGLEYILVPMLLGAYLVLLCVIKLISFIVVKLRKTLAKTSA